MPTEGYGIGVGKREGTAAMLRTRIVGIGDSQGIRIPRVLLEWAGLGEDVEIQVGVAQLVIRPAARARQGWDEHFKAMAEWGDDGLLDGEAVRTTA